MKTTASTGIATCPFLSRVLCIGIPLSKLPDPTWQIAHDTTAALRDPFEDGPVEIQVIYSETVPEAMALYESISPTPPFSGVILGEGLLPPDLPPVLRTLHLFRRSRNRFHEITSLGYYLDPVTALGLEDTSA